MSPRPIDYSSEADANDFWDVEALKLQMFHPEVFLMYTKHPDNPAYKGFDGLGVLGFLEINEFGEIMGFGESPFNARRVSAYGRPLIDACVRISKL